MNSENFTNEKYFSFTPQNNEMISERSPIEGEITLTAEKHSSTNILRHIQSTISDL